MNKAIGFVMLGTNDLEKSSKFYDAILAHLKMKRVTVTERYIGYGFSEDDGAKFYICLLYTSPSPRDLSTSRMPSSA